MLSVSNQNKIPVYRRFLEGWFSVFLVIFMVTLLVRLFLFNIQMPLSKDTAVLKANVKASRTLHKSIALTVKLNRYNQFKKNQASFGAMTFSTNE